MKPTSIHVLKGAAALRCALVAAAALAGRQQSNPVGVLTRGHVVAAAVVKHTPLDAAVGTDTPLPISA